MTDFYTFIKLKGYKEVSRAEDKIVLEQETNNGVFTVIFDTKQKYINAALMPNKLIRSDTEILRLAKDWEQLKKDINEFKEMSKYNILYPTSEVFK